MQTARTLRKKKQNKLGDTSTTINNYDHLNNSTSKHHLYSESTATQPQIEPSLFFFLINFSIYHKTSVKFSLSYNATLNIIFFKENDI